MHSSHQTSLPNSSAEAVTSNVAARFSAAAASYEKSVTVLDEVARDLLECLPSEFSPRRLLEPGCGTGVLTRRLAERFPEAAIDAFDLSSQMVKTAQQVSGGVPNVSWHTADFNEAWPGPYSGVISSASLHWARSRAAVFAALDAGLASGGLFHSALMLNGTLAEVHAARAATVAGKPSYATLPEFSDITQELEHTGWACQSAEERHYSVVHANAREALRNLHDQGVTGGQFSRGPAPLMRTELQALMAYYDQHFAVPGGVSATYKVGFFSFRKL